MQVHPEEFAWAQAYLQQHPFEPLSKDQLHSIMAKGRELHAWYRSHYRTHCLLNLIVLIFLFSSQYLILLKLPAVWLTQGGPNSIVRILTAGFVCGLLHSWLMYSLGVFTIHEGASHKIIFPVRGPLSRFGTFVTSNVPRLIGAVPDYYSRQHMIHHAKFGTMEDAEFINFVTPRRFWRTLLPFAVAINYSDFIIHRPAGYTKSRMITILSFLLYFGAYGYAMYTLWGGWFMLIVLGLLAHLPFYMDRLRQYTEHNLMPLDNVNGSRSFGFGLWGMLIGGGPWGTPCHWEHHLVASIPWYQQMVLHRYVVRLLTARQRAQFLFPPVVGFPRLLWRIVRESYSMIEESGAQKPLAAGAKSTQPPSL